MAKPPVAGLSKKISSLFTGRYAWITNSLVGGSLFVIGDTLQQRIEMYRGQETKFDLERTKRIAIVGVLSGPSHHFYYRWLDKYIPGRDVKQIGKKLVADQVLASPLFGIQFFMGMSLLEGKTWLESWNEFVEKFPPVFILDCCLWPPLQLINFLWIPSRFRVLYINFLTIFWNAFLSYMKHRDQYPDSEHPDRKHK